MCYTALHFLFPPATIFFWKNLCLEWGGAAWGTSCATKRLQKNFFCIIVLQHLYAFPVPHLAKLTIYFPLSENRVLGEETRVYTFGALFRSRQVVPPPRFLANPIRYIGVCAAGGGHFADEKRGAGALSHCGKGMWYSWEVHTWVPL